MTDRITRDLDHIVTDFHHALTVKKSVLQAALIETQRDFGAHGVLREARQIIGALIDRLRDG